MKLRIIPLEQTALGRLKKFTDQTIGDGYYSELEIKEIFEKSLSIPIDGISTMCSFLLVDETDEIFGVRFTYPPGRWSRGKGEGLNPNKWPYDINETAYFQSLFLSPKIQGKGWGSKLSMASIEVLNKIGARGVVCHSWKESPFNSSTKYLEKMGFVKIAEHPLYWQHVNYNCTRCLKPPCQCTAVEMYLNLENQKNRSADQESR